MHGSDYPVPVGAHWARWRGLIDTSTARRCARLSNPLERDFQLKTATGFPRDTFTRINQLLRQTTSLSSRQETPPRSLAATNAP